MEQGPCLNNFPPAKIDPGNPGGDLGRRPAVDAVLCGCGETVRRNAQAVLTAQQYRFIPYPHILHAGNVGHGIIHADLAALGHLLRNYEDSQGVKRTGVDIVAQDVEFLTPRQGGGDDFGYDAPAQSNSGSSRGAKPQLQPFDDDGDIPF